MAQGVMHVANDRDRKLAATLAGYGVPHKDIGLIIGINPLTLVKYYGVDMQQGMAIANSKIAKTLFDRAMEGDLGAAIFWAKARMGWREKHDVNLTGDGPGGEILIRIVDPKK